MVFHEMIDTNRSPQSIVNQRGLEQVSDAATIERSVDQVVRSNPKQVADYRGGNEKIFGFLVGQVMKLSQGKANPQKVNEILKAKLSKNTSNQN